MKNAEDFVSLNRNRVAVKNLSIFGTLGNYTELMEPIHKVQVMSIKISLDNRMYITKTELNTMLKTLGRYRKIVEERYGASPKTDFFHECLAEISSFIDYANKLESSIKVSSSEFEVRKRE
jgi:hypothetical protein